MTELFEKSIHTLELPRVLELLAAEAVTDEGKELCRSARPSADKTEVLRLQKQTSAAFDMLVKRGTPSLAGIRPVAAALQRADRGGSLNTRELLDIAQVLRCARAGKIRDGEPQACQTDRAGRFRRPIRQMDAFGRGRAGRSVPAAR